MKIKQWKLLKPFLKKEINGGSRSKSLLHYFFA
jgi:hypothetical protein